MGASGVTGTAGTCPQSGLEFTICSVVVDPTSHHVFVGGWAPVGDDAIYTENSGVDGGVNALAGVTATGSKHYVLIGGGFLAAGDGTTSVFVGGLLLFDTTAGPYTNPLVGYHYFPANGTAGVSGTVYALYADGTNCYVGGSFSGA